ncbi:MerR family transcriptional regulator [Nocardioides panaciterrulae]|uniref:DNA-binding transcriptional MerR regulator n=1 Tax=Nocardioides panaciterrulae TaxID=661492 RepID=A0A7Y9E2S0_9ACTN|nr:MerR family transcriptional regulator [Nocardioides panaciterrulae]NYD40049.1 DNA-binding transcriptional MerR regulator [Nocardioides panaciterrulae]
MGRQHMQIGEVANRTGLSLRTIRYYEEMGLVVPSARTTGGFRLYTESDVARLMVIKRMKPLEFSLEEMSELLGTLDALERQDPEADRSVLLARLSLFHEAALARVDAIRAQLAVAEGFAEELRGAVAKQRRSARH